ncbi:MAG: chemotaxis protein CheX [bacterium]|nr:chemotaxis protein CheX [bacterium]
MDVRYINPFIESIKNVFTTMLSTELLLSKPFVKTDHEPGADVSAIIGLSGDVVGSVAICLKMDTAIKTASKFSGMELTQEHEDFADALGELANMVAGGAKAKFEGLNASISLPNVIVGPGHSVQQSKQAPRLVLPCDSPLGRFSVEVAMVVEKRAAAQPATAAVGA